MREKTFLKGEKMSNSQLSRIVLFVAVVVVSLFAGCAPSRLTPFSELDPDVVAFRGNTRATLAANLGHEMSIEDVRSIWHKTGAAIIGGVVNETSQPGDDALPKCVLSNPYRSETRIMVEGHQTKIVLIQWYYTDMEKNDGRITEDELTPVVFDDSGKIIGWGRDFLPQLHEYIERINSEGEK